MSTRRSKSCQFIRHEDATGMYRLLAKVREQQQQEFTTNAKLRIKLVSLLLTELVNELDCLAEDLADHGPGG